VRAKSPKAGHVSLRNQRKTARPAVDTPGPTEKDDVEPSDQDGRRLPELTQRGLIDRGHDLTAPSSKAAPFKAVDRHLSLASRE